MATQYATVVSKAAAISQDPNEIDINVTVDAGATATPELMSPTQGGTVTVANMGFAGANGIIDDQAYGDDQDGSIGSVSKFAPGHGYPDTAFRNEKKVAMAQGGYAASGVAGTGALGMATIPTADDTIVIDSITYTWVAVPAAAYDLDIGNLAACQATLVAAINGTGTSGATSHFAGTMPHPTVTATAFAADVMVVTAKNPGRAANAIVLGETFTDATDAWTRSTIGLAEGFLGMATNPTADDTIVVGGITYTFVASPAVAFDIDIGASVAVTQASLVDAINDGTNDSATTYFAGSGPHAQVTIGAFASDVAKVQAKVTVAPATADLIATTETFTDGTDAWVAATLEGENYGQDIAPRTSLEPLGISADVALKDQN